MKRNDFRPELFAIFFLGFIVISVFALLVCVSLAYQETAYEELGSAFCSTYSINQQFEKYENNILTCRKNPHVESTNYYITPLRGTT